MRTFEQHKGRQSAAHARRGKKCADAEASFKNSGTHHSAQTVDSERQLGLARAVQNSRNGRGQWERELLLVLQNDCSSADADTS